MFVLCYNPHPVFVVSATGNREVHFFCICFAHSFVQIFGIVVQIESRHFTNKKRKLGSR